jgi:hypothetical protein
MLVDGATFVTVTMQFSLIDWLIADRMEYVWIIGSYLATKNDRHKIQIFVYVVYVKWCEFVSILAVADGECDDDRP